MKILKSLFALLFFISLAIPVNASTVLMPDLYTKDEESVLEENNETFQYRSQLITDMVLIENLKLEDLSDFIIQNEKWIQDVNSRLESYIYKQSDNKFGQSEALKDLLDEVSQNVSVPSSNVYIFSTFSISTVNEYFYSHIYHLRNNYWTYSLDPKLSVRVLDFAANLAWSELKTIYVGIQIDNGSLYDQYMCHKQLVIEQVWDLERWVPNVGYLGVLASLCNPHLRY